MSIHNPEDAQKKKGSVLQETRTSFQYRSEFYMPDSRFSVFFYNTNRSVQDVTYFLFFFLVKRTRKSKTRRPSTEPLKKKKREEKKNNILPDGLLKIQDNVFFFLFSFYECYNVCCDDDNDE